MLLRYPRRLVLQCIYSLHAALEARRPLAPAVRPVATFQWRPLAPAVRPLAPPVRLFLEEQLGAEAYLRDVVRKMKGFSQSSTPDKMDEREQLSIDKVETSSKKIKKSQEGISLTNTRMVYKEEKLSIMGERYETSLLEPAAMICQPCTFRPGQSILQWWAEWMKDCDTLGSAPKSYNNRKGTKFKRPAWFSGEVAAGPFEDSIVYAGVPYKGECYQVY